MYKLLIVDDEDFEREGMAHLIDWGKYEIEMVGTAWNGVDAFQQIEKLHPDMVLTDIKMPVMNGIELIQKVRETYPDIEFAVLSGYGEYEFTSKAMEQGVRHYVLKPCDEDKVLEVMGKVKKDVDARRKRICREEEYRNRIMPKARQQLFRNILLEREDVRADRLFTQQEEAEGLPGRVRLLVFRGEESFDELEEFALGNILGELMGEQRMKTYVSTVVKNDAVMLVTDTEPEKLVPIVCRLRREFGKIRKEPVRAALSGSGDMGSLAALYRQTQELFNSSDGLEKEALLHDGLFDGKKQNTDFLVDFAVIGKTCNYAELLQALQLAFLRMQYRSFSFSDKRDMMNRVLRITCLESLREEESPVDENAQDLMITAARQIFRRSERREADNKESIRYRQILEEIYRHFQDQEFCLHYLAAEILYMNENYCGKLFLKMCGKKFTKFLLDARIAAAEQLMRLEPDIMVGRVSEMVGFASDGQYFSKAFKKSKGMAPSEYREKIRLGDSGIA